MTITGSRDSSSGEEDGDANWKAAINSVASVGVSSSKGLTKPRNGGLFDEQHPNHADEKKAKSNGVKLYQIKARKLLTDFLDKNIEIVTTHTPVNKDHQSDGGVIKLFRKAPPGIRVDPIDQGTGSQKKPRIISGKEIVEKPKK